ncbi:MAG TPA: alpha/beta hydrolase-fold protein [Myxococcales bacterium]|nr:alpha/beta hydrolase-fold protein [Myxococcales bacterium]
MRTAKLSKRTRAGLVVASALLCACPSGPAHPVTVNFNVGVPSTTPTTASISIVGDAPALGSVKPPGLVLDKVAEGLYRGKAVLEAESLVHFQILQSSPGAIELRDDYTVPERTFTAGSVNGPEKTLTLGVARWQSELPSSKAYVTFEVTAGPTTPPGDTLYLTGDAPELGAWRPNAVPLFRRTDGKYVTRVGLEKESTVQLKVTRGSWLTQERGPGAEDVPNHTYAVPSDGGLAEVTTSTWQDLEPTAILTGEIRYERAVTSTFLGNTRDVIIHLPVGYLENPNARYPVLYMQDGQNLMDPRTGFGGKEWGVDETAQRLQRCGLMSPVIVVGVYNTGNRIAEYTPVPNAPYGGGDADNYGRFLLEELKPIIDSRYRTLNVASSPTTGIAGSSLGGLVSLYLGRTHPEVFARVGAVSPSIWWANKDIIARYQALSTRLPLKIWEDMGTNEGSTPQDELNDARALRDVLLAKGWRLGDDLEYLEAQGAEHNEASWALRIGTILSYLYPPQ